MDFRSQGEQPARQTSAHPAQVVAEAPRSLSRLLVTLLVVLALLAVVGVLWRTFTGLTADSSIKGKQFQALFLTNGQVYFGHLSSVNGQYVKLKDIFYLQVQQTVQPSSDNNNSNNNQQVSLAKLGNELHGPEDTMYVNRDQVLFWENLKADGKVVKAITDYQSSNKK
jgi:hypothetical protein